MKVFVYTPWPVPFWQIPKPQLERLRERFPDVTFVQPGTEGEAFSEIVDADIALSSRLSAEIVQRAARLKWVHSTAASVGTLALDKLAARGIVVTNSRGIQAIAMAEQLMGGLLVLVRRLDATLAAQRERRWIQNELSGDLWPGRLYGRSMTILGFGTIGREVASRAHAFGMRVTALRRRVDRPKPAFVERVVGPAQLDDALKACDVLVLSAPALPETDRLIGRDQIALLNRGAIIANVARGRIVVESAMIDALQAGQLGGAVLDVFDHEPLPATSPLWTLPNVVITPHSSGIRADHWQDSIDLFTENFHRFRRGEPLRNLVEPAAGY